MVHEEQFDLYLISLTFIYNTNAVIIVFTLEILFILKKNIDAYTHIIIFVMLLLTKHFILYMFCNR